MVRCLLVTLFCGLNQLVCAQSDNDDGNVTISNKYEIYEYKIGANRTPVVESKQTTTYLCNKFRVNIPVQETYNEKVSIDEVLVYTDGKRNRSITPEYTYYSIENIFYSDARVCRFMLPLSSRGSTSEVQFRETISDPRYFSRIWLQNQYRTQQHKVDIIVPRWMKISLREMNFGNNITRQTSYDAKKDADIFSYIITDAAAFDDEENAPGPSYVVPHLLVLAQDADTPSGKQVYFPTLDDLYAWYRSLLQQVVDDDALLKAKAEEITKDCTTDIDKMKAVYAWVQTNIRYIAFEDGIAGFKPDNAQDVMRKRYGDCKGMANLTRNLLKALGLDARMCWLGTNHIAYDYSTPSMAVDNHAICAVLYEGKIYYLDATARYLGFGQYAEHIQGRQVLIEDGDKYLLERLPSTTYLQNTEKEFFRMEIDGSTLMGHVTNSMSGENKEYFLRGVHAIRKEKREDVLTAFYSMGSGFEMSNLEEAGMTTTLPDVTVDYDFKLKNGIQTFGDEWYVEVDLRKELLFSEIDTVKRKLDYWFPYKGHIIQQTELILPAGSEVVSVPGTLHIEREGYRFDISYHVKDGKVIYTKELILSSTQLPKSQFAQWNTDLQQLKKIYLEQTVISKKGKP